jgi:hypothetical protein
MSYNKRVTYKIRSARSPLIMGRREKANNWVNWGTLERFEIGFFGGRVQRRGVHVNIPEIGSRGDAFCIGGILGFYADLRRELDWGNWELVFLEFWSGLHVSLLRRGDNLVCILCSLGEFKWLNWVGEDPHCVEWPKSVRGEGFLRDATVTGEGITLQYCVWARVFCEMQLSLARG